jgi:hypothetical protein
MHLCQQHMTSATTPIPTLQVGLQRAAPALPEGLPQEVERLLTACLEPEPHSRPTAQQVLKVRPGGVNATLSSTFVCRQ